MASAGDISTTGSLREDVKLSQTNSKVLTDARIGVVKAALHVLHGPAKVAKFLLGVNSLRPAEETYELREVNGLPAIVCFNDGRATAVIALEVEGGAITAVYSVVDPRKLGRL